MEMARRCERDYRGDVSSRIDAKRVPTRPVGQEILIHGARVSDELLPCAGRRSCLNRHSVGSNNAPGVKETEPHGAGPEREAIGEVERRAG